MWCETSHRIAAVKIARISSPPIDLPLKFYIFGFFVCFTPGSFLRVLHLAVGVVFSCSDKPVRAPSSPDRASCPFTCCRKWGFGGTRPLAEKTEGDMSSTLCFLEKGVMHCSPSSKEPPTLCEVFLFCRAF